MKLAVVKERHAEERRVAASPETVKRFVSWGFDVAVESGAGMGASFLDSAYADAGASLAANGAEACAGADVVVKVRVPDLDEIAHMRDGAVLVGLLNPFNRSTELAACAKRGVTAFALELLPRISRAQSMDALSSQSNLAGYKAVIDAAAKLKSVFPLMMTAAGTVAPARVFVMGAGVAGLQAIATAKRLGAVVSATDVRADAKEQVESLSADFVMVDATEGEAGETSGGYAKEMSADYQRRQAELVAETVKSQDIVITTALIPGKPAPKLITEDMVLSMKPGSIIVDLAVEQGGNCALSKPGDVVEINGVTIMGEYNLPGAVAADASALYARNVMHFVELFHDPDAGSLVFDWADEILGETVVTRDGNIVHPAVSELAS